MNFAGPLGTFEYYSVSDLYYKRIPREEFKNKLVLIGATSPDIHDDYFVPTSKGKAMPGVEIHANTIQTLIKKDFLQVQPKWSAILLILITAIITTLIVSRFHILGAAITAGAMIIAYIFAAILIFDKGIIMNIIYVPLTTAITSFSTIAYMYLTEKNQKYKS
ncbi:CHASE2 domain-containing protein [Candidatus Woesearchaeota archaeon]|nr:CHASE2 domain-containing protein [Candidatus Woesearchaeota archaeon]